MASTELVSVEFHGDTILATGGQENGVLVGVKKICDSLGLGYGSQLQKLRKAHWAGVTMIVTPDSRGCEQETCMIPLAKLPMWMVTIAASKVRPELREKLLAYQVEAAEVLARHFMPDVNVPAAQTSAPRSSVPDRLGDEPDPKDFAARLQRMDVLAGILEEVRRTIATQAEQEKHLLAVERKADAALSASAGDTGFMSLLGYCRLHKIPADRKELAQIGYTLKKVCTAWGLTVRTAHHEVYGKVNLYPVEALDRWASTRP